MTTTTDIVNQALQFMGSRTNVTPTELANAIAGLPAGPYASPISNEAIQAALVLGRTRDTLNRMAPWDCVTKWASLTYITTTPGNPENPTAGSPLWQPGSAPPPPWNYEYQYPVDCMRARKIIPQYTTQAGGVPIFPTGTVTGAGQVGWTGPALKFKVATDLFFGVTAASVVSGGTGFSVEDQVVLAQPTYTFSQNTAPVGQPASYTTVTANSGAPVTLEVEGVSGGAITSVSVVNQVEGETGESGTPIGGSYYSVPANPVAMQYSISGTNPGQQSGTGATFNLTFQTDIAPQRVILCNQSQAVLCYNTQITDPNVMDKHFRDAWVAILAARLCYQLSGDKAAANLMIAESNNIVMEARKSDGNEGITVNDVTPDFIRSRGGYGVGPNFEYSPNLSFDWGAFWSPY